MNKEMKKRVLSIITILGIIFGIIFLGIIHAWYEEKRNLRVLYLEGQSYYNRNDYDNALKCFREAAEQGHAKAKAMLDKMQNETTKTKSDSTQ